MVVDEIPVHILDHQRQLVDLLVIEQRAALGATSEGGHQSAALMERLHDQIVALFAGNRIFTLVELPRRATKLGIPAKGHADAPRPLCARFGVTLTGGSVADHAVLEERAYAALD